MSNIDTTTTFLKILSVIITLIIAASVIATPNIKESFLMYPMSATLQCEPDGDCKKNKPLTGSLSSNKFVSSQNKSLGLNDPYETNMTESPSIEGTRNMTVRSIPQNFLQSARTKAVSLQTQNLSGNGEETPRQLKQQVNNSTLNSILNFSNEPPSLNTMVETFQHSNKSDKTIKKPHSHQQDNKHDLNPHIPNGGVRTTQLGYKQKMEEGRLQSAKLDEASLSLPTNSMTYDAGEDLTNDALNPSALSCRYVYSSKKDRLYGQGDFIRGDLPIKPDQGNWFRVSSRLSMLNTGAMLAIDGGVSSDRQGLMLPTQGQSIGSYMQEASGSGISTAGGANLSINNSMGNTITVSSAGM